ncbi:electron transfer flavoprotein subunit alpha/FixB family protein [Salmonella enterica]|uniref:Protein FixB n=17 Tax=Pseudomonadati TaxID=3379134 RepID=A0A5U1QLG9_SALER|nr:electron transfer flavoprotein subunit alpha/FixB family protein [Salmonella enterica]EAW1996001.1 electron transfer flavoprotein subunit alpha/FixB family protein [Salmonella enterica subsp. enterica]EBM9778769.1 electron transfer flavoprotein subunit alpha/FixB family protein [Salmonella enterica subsp. enterica serovar Enteritidis]ECF6495101.1 electron transfer flavoprotein subunit alpha/FixB family protein [Salmonella enterica subsp. enterica serovar Infantis]ECU5737898.1 electron transf
MNKFSSVWVFSDTPSRLPELMSGAQAVGEKVNAFVLNEADSATACHLGADHVWLLSGKPEDRMIEDYAAAMAETIRQHSEGGAVLLPNTRRGKLLAAKLGYRLSAAVSNDASDVSLQDGKAAVKHMVYGGLAIGAETIASPFAVITLSSGTFDAQQPDASRSGEMHKPDASRSGEMHTVQWQAPATAVTRTATQARQSNSVDLDKARLVVSVGRGIGSKENISLAEALCQTIGAELACSRPVAENEKWMEHERYVGISNLMLKPELYLAVGISGQIQHMVGANGAQTIFAINKDKNAPIFQYADFGIVGDALKILPALTAALAR